MAAFILLRIDVNLAGILGVYGEADPEGFVWSEEWVESTGGGVLVRGLALYPEKSIFRLKWRALVNFERYFLDDRL